MKNCLVLATGVVLVSAMSASAATISTFTTEAAYNGAVGSQLFLLDFNGEPVGSGSGNFAAGVDFGSPEASDPSLVFFNSGAMTDNGSTVASNFVGPVGGVFDGPVYAFGLVFSSSGNPQTVELYDSGNTLLGTAATPSNGFFGLLSDTPIASFVIRNGEFVPGERDRFFVDDFRVNAVPEPGTLVMLAAGIVGLLRKRSGVRQVS